MNWTDIEHTPIHTRIHLDTQLASGDSTVIICHLQAWVALAWRGEEAKSREMKQGERMLVHACVCLFGGGGAKYTMWEETRSQ